MMTALVKFFHKDHRYQSRRRNLKSVTSVLDKYRKPFDAEYWSLYKAAQSLMDPRLFHNLIMQYPAGSPECLEAIKAKFPGTGDLLERRAARIRQGWDLHSYDRRRKGTAFHEAKEAESYESGYERSPFDGKRYRTVWKADRSSPDNANLTTDLWDLPDGYYPELLLWNFDVGLAGQADKVWITSADARYVDIDDWKTGKPIKRRGYKYRDGSRAMLLSPVDHLEDCSFNRYALQISLYAWMLEQFGFQVRHTAFHHYHRRYDVPYLRAEVLNILTDALQKGYLNP